MARILLIDSYDSYTCNLEKLVEKVIDGTVVTIRNDSLDQSHLVNQVLPLFDAVIVGPGPGSVINATDVGVLNSLWSLDDDHMIPVLGVCLGFQSMAYNFNGKIHKLKTVKHGQPSKIKHDGTGIFKNIPQHYSCIRYNSLCVTVDDESDFKITAYAQDDDDLVAMGGQHKQKPFYGVQFHPESICSEFGDQLIENFWNLAKQWSKDYGRIRKENDEYLTKLIHDSSIIPEPMTEDCEVNSVDNEPISVDEEAPVWRKIDYSGTFPIINVCESINNDFILLHSGREPGRWSIIGCLIPNSTKIIKHFAYPPVADVIHYGIWKSSRPDEQRPIKDGIWKELTRYMKPLIKKYQRECRKIDANIPFTGGLVGYFSYEEGCCTMPHTDELRQEEFTGTPDTYLADCTECIAIDNETKCAYIISLKSDEKWVKSVCDTINRVLEASSPVKTPDSPQIDRIEMPDQSEYMEKVKKCQNLLHEGESYELCLTDQTTIRLKQPIKPWDLYKTLLLRNPAPYSIYMDFEDSVLVGASPERFMNWNRDGKCEFRPIKGTVKKGPTMTEQRANEILNSDKERGENLMIVDLIRHDLNMILNDVNVELMRIEEYETVYQLVSVISGQLYGNYRGIDVLAHSLPPGSMTGAPKIRSVQLLRQLEHHKPRGMYAGVAGYWSVTDQGDWSVIIRSAMSYNNDTSIWKIGAGGAITVLSDCQDEWNEMCTKLESALKSFQA